jgi:hypothetical protein
MTADFLPLRLLLLAKGQRFGRQVLKQVATIVTPDTILRWYRRLIAGTFTLLAGQTLVGGQRRGSGGLRAANLPPTPPIRKAVLCHHHPRWLTA